MSEEEKPIDDDAVNEEANTPPATDAEAIAMDTSEDEPNLYEIHHPVDPEFVDMVEQHGESEATRQRFFQKHRHKHHKRRHVHFYLQLIVACVLVAVVVMIASREIYKVEMKHAQLSQQIKSLTEGQDDSFSNIAVFVVEDAESLKPLLCRPSKTQKETQREIDIIALFLEPANEHKFIIVCRWTDEVTNTYLNLNHPGYRPITIDLKKFRSRDAELKLHEIGLFKYHLQTPPPGTAPSSQPNTQPNHHAGPPGLGA